MHLATMLIAQAQLITFQEAAYIANDLGIDLRRSTFAAWIKRGQLPSSKVGGRRLVLKSDLIEKLKNR